MCGRFTQRLSSSEFARIFDARDLADGGGDAFNVAPTQPVTVILDRDGQRVADRFRWGLVPHWAKDLSRGGRLINARAETVATSPVFRHSFRARRCLIPVDGFYEWQRLPAGRQPYYITSLDGSPLTFAGIWSAWHDGSTGFTLLTCSIVTTTPNETMAPIHNRMPVILQPDAWAPWLEATTDAGELGGLLRPSAAELVAVPVSSRVNSVRNQGAELVAPVALAPAGAGHMGASSY